MTQLNFEYYDSQLTLTTATDDLMRVRFRKYQDNYNLQFERNQEFQMMA